MSVDLEVPVLQHAADFVPTIQNIIDAYTRRLTEAQQLNFGIRDDDEDLIRSARFECYREFLRQLVTLRNAMQKPRYTPSSSLS